MRPHFKTVLLCPALLERNHEVRHQGHLFKFPLSVALDVFVVVACRHQESLAVEDWLGFEVGKAVAAIAVNMDDVIVNELFDPGNAGPIAGFGAWLV